MTENLDDDITLEKALKEASKAFTPPDGLKEGMRASLLARETKADSSDMPMATRSRTLLWRCAAAAVAACVLIGLTVWLIWSAETNDNRARQKQEPVIGVISTPHPVAATTDLPQASWAAYYRAWLQSPETLDETLARDAASRLKPERNLAGLNVRSFLQTMNHIEEKPNENHSVRGCGVDSVV